MGSKRIINVRVPKDIKILFYNDIIVNKSKTIINSHIDNISHEICINLNVNNIQGKFTFEK